MKESNKIKVKVVVVAMFERGTPDDGNPGELELWVQREKLEKRIPFPVGHFDLRMNDEGMLAVLTGMGPSNAATIVTALAYDPRFDLSKAYWIVAGIAGVDQADASIGSAAWAEYVIEGDIMHEMDSQEIPDDWPYGKLALFTQEPNKRSTHPADKEIAFKLNKDLVNWAYELTKDYPLNSKLSSNRSIQTIYAPSSYIQMPVGFIQSDSSIIFNKFLTYQCC